MCCSRDWLTIISCRARSSSFVSPLKRLYFLPSFSTFGISMLQPRYYKDFNAPASINQITLNSSPLSIQKTTMRVIEEHLLRREVFRTYCHTALHTSVVKIEASQIYSPMLTTTRISGYFDPSYTQKAMEMPRKGLAAMDKKNRYICTGSGAFRSILIGHWAVLLHFATLSNIACVWS